MGDAVTRQRALALSEFEELGEFEEDRAGPAAEPKPKNPAEELFAKQCVVYRLPVPERQLQFARATHQRGWKFDFAFRDHMVAVEIEGITPRKLASGLLVMAGRHGSVKGVIEDMEKYNTAGLLGWTVLRFPPKYVKPRRAVEMTMRVLATRGWEQPT